MADITYIVENLFPQGVDSIPTELAIENKIKKGTFTVRDAILLKVYQDGIAFGPEDIETNSAAVKKIIRRANMGGGKVRVGDISGGVERKR